MEAKGQVMLAPRWTRVTRLHLNNCRDQYTDHTSTTLKRGTSILTIPVPHWRGGTGILTIPVPHWRGGTGILTIPVPHWRGGTGILTIPVPHWRGGTGILTIPAPHWRGGTGILTIPVPHWRGGPVYWPYQYHIEEGGPVYWPYQYHIEEGGPVYWPYQYHIEEGGPVYWPYQYHIEEGGPVYWPYQYHIEEGGPHWEWIHATIQRQDNATLDVRKLVGLGLLGINASATARVMSRLWNDDEISFLVEETRVPGGNHRPTASNWRNFSHIQPLPSPGIEPGPPRCEAKWAKAWWARRLSSPSYHGPPMSGSRNWRTKLTHTEESQPYILIYSEILVTWSLHGPRYTSHPSACFQGATWGVCPLIQSRWSYWPRTVAPTEYSYASCSFLLDKTNILIFCLIAFNTVHRVHTH